MIIIFLTTEISNGLFNFLNREMLQNMSEKVLNSGSKSLIAQLFIFKCMNCLKIFIPILSKISQK